MNKRIEYLIHFLGGVIVVAIFAYMAYRQYTPEYRAELMLSSEGVVIEKVADPAGYTWGFWEGNIVYRPDRYYLKVRLDNGRVTELKVDEVTYMHTNVGDRVKNQ